MDGDKMVFRIDGRELVKTMEKNPDFFRPKKPKAREDSIPPELTLEQKAKMTPEQIEKYNKNREVWEKALQPLPELLPEEKATMSPEEIVTYEKRRKLRSKMLEWRKINIERQKLMHNGPKVTDPKSVLIVDMQLTDLDKSKGTCRVVATKMDIKITDDVIKEIEEKKLKGKQKYECKIRCEEKGDPVLTVFAVSDDAGKRYLPVYIHQFDPEKVEVYEMDAGLLVECATEYPDLFLEKFGLKTKGFVTKMALTDFSAEDSTARIRASDLRVKIDEKYFRDGKLISYQYQLKKGADNKLLIEVRGINTLIKLKPLR